eukprot:m.265038 g.265038  ORF g.265038 m.265038 type:complete len:1552 (+) comp19254_c0_seq10:56-4711(+)
MGDFARFGGGRKRHSRLMEVLTLAQQGTLPPPVTLDRLPEKEVCTSLFHVSTELRKRVVDELRTSGMVLTPLLIKVVKALQEPVVEGYQRLASGYNSLSRLDCQEPFAALPKEIVTAFVSCCAEHLATCDDPRTKVAAAQAARDLGVLDAVALQLLTNVESAAQTKRVQHQLVALCELHANHPDTPARILAVLCHLAPTGLTDLRTKAKQRACLDEALELLLALPDDLYTDCVADMLLALLSDPKAYATRHHAATQRDRVVAAVLQVLFAKYAGRVKAQQDRVELRMCRMRQQQEEAPPGMTEATGAPLDPPEPMEHGSEEQAREDQMCGQILSAVQDCLGDRCLPVRKIATRFMHAVAGTLLAKVVTQQLWMWVSSDSAFDSVCALSDLVGLILECDDAILDPLLEMLEHHEPRARQAAVTCLHQLIETPSVADACLAGHFGEAFDLVKTHVSEMFADIMLTSMTAPKLSMFARQAEDASTKTGTLNLLRVTEQFDHEAVCNAILALQDADESVQVAGARYLAVASFVCPGDDRKPAISAMAGLLSHKMHGWHAKIPVLHTLSELRARKGVEELVFETAAFDALVTLFFDPDTQTRQLAATVTSRLVKDETSIRKKLADSIKGYLVNAEEPEDTALAIHAAATIGCRDPVLIELMNILTRRPQPLLRAAVFDAWRSLHCLHKKLVSIARQFLRSSHLALRLSACRFVFEACAVIVDSDVQFVDDDIVQAATSILTESSPEETTATATMRQSTTPTGKTSPTTSNTVRHAALLLLRCLASSLISSGDDAERDATDELQPVDRFNLKASLRTYLEANSHHDDTHTQTLAWSFFTDFFPFAKDDLELFRTSYQRGEQARLQHGKDNTATAEMARLVLRTADDAECVLKLMIEDSLFGHLYFECMLRYAQSAQAQAPVTWPRLHGQLKNKVSVEASLLAAEFIRASEACEPLPLPDAYVAVGDRDEAVNDAGEGSSATFVAMSQPVASAGVPRRQLPVPIGAGMRALKHEQAKQQVNDQDIRKKLMAAERAANGAKEELNRVKRELSVAQKALRDERKIRQLLEARSGPAPAQSASQSQSARIAPTIAAIASEDESSSEDEDEEPKYAHAYAVPSQRNETDEQEAVMAAPPGLMPPGLSATSMSPPRLPPARALVNDPRTERARQVLAAEQKFLCRLDVFCKSFCQPMSAFEAAKQDPELPSYPLTYLFHVLIGVSTFHKQLVEGLTKAVKGNGGAFNAVAFAGAYASLQPLLAIHVRYRSALVRADALVEQWEKEKAAGYSQLQEQCLSAATAAMPSFDPAEQCPTARAWLAVPVPWLASAKRTMEVMLGLTQLPAELEVISSNIGMLQNVISLQAEAGGAASAALCEDNASEYQRFCLRKFKASCPELFCPYRIFIKRWMFRQLKSKRDSLLPSRDSRGPSSSWPKFDGKSRKAAWSAMKGSGFSSTAEEATLAGKAAKTSEVKLYLFNDALMCASKKLGKPTARFFALLPEIEILHTSTSPDVVGVKVQRAGDKEPACYVFKATSREELQGFVDAVQEELQLTRLTSAVPS